jgi:hypothetical protein
LALAARGGGQTEKQCDPSIHRVFGFPELMQTAFVDFDSYRSTISYAAQGHLDAPAAKKLVAQIFDLLYRRFAIGKASNRREALGFTTAPASSPELVRNLRYSRLQICGTLSPRSVGKISDANHLQLRDTLEVHW